MATWLCQCMIFLKEYGVPEENGMHNKFLINIPISSYVMLDVAVVGL